MRRLVEGASHFLSSSPPSADGAQVVRHAKDHFRFGERDRPGRTIRRLAEWPGEGSGRQNLASDRDNNRHRAEAKGIERGARVLQDAPPK